MEMTKEELSKLYQDILLELPGKGSRDSLKSLQQKIKMVLRHGSQKKIKDETLVSELIHLVPIMTELKARHRFEAQVALSLPQVLSVCDRLAAIRLRDYEKIEEDKPSLTELFACFYHGRKEILLLPPAKAFRTRYIEMQILAKVKETVPERPPEEYPLAREMKRHFILHIGATNTGKTHDALEDLKMASEGVYLAPLRLLAMEVQEKMLDEGIFCSLLTGEEEDIRASATLLAATVEKLDIHHSYETAVIDECQMISDPQRGAAWTRAILGIRAERIHLCMAPEAERIIRALIADCKDSFEIVRHRRRTPLIYQDKPYRFPKDITPGDALVVFSRKTALSLAAELRRDGIQAGVIYGALPYAARKRQVRRFLDGETKVLVTTDAIGMGMNLPIRRIVFMDIVKYDGKERRLLTTAETKQIAGRAGRLGMYDEGYVTCIEKSEVIRDNLETETEEITQARLNFSEALLDSDYDLEKLIRMWSFAQVPEKYNKMDTEEPLTLLKALRKAGVKASGREANAVLYQMITVGFDIEVEELMEQWLEACLMYLDGTDRLPFPDCQVTELSEMELACRKLDLYYQLCHRFGLPCEEERVAAEKDRLAASIDETIAKNIQNYHKRCRICGRPLAWNTPFGVCSRCFENERSRHGGRYRESKERTKEKSLPPVRLSSGHARRENGQKR